MKNIKLLWGIIIVLLLIVSVLGFKFVNGSVAPSEDDRVAIILNKDERNFILDEMREFLKSVQAVSQAITAKDLEKVARLATTAGMEAEANTPGALFRKIPLGMKKLGFDTRKKFDKIADAAKANQDPLVLRKQLDSLLSNCIACHAAFRLPEPQE